MRILAIIFCRLPFVLPNNAPDLIEYVHRYAARRVAQMVQNSGGGKLYDALKIDRLQIVRRVQPAARQEGILDTGSQQIPKPYGKIQLVQPLQKTAARIIRQVLQMVPVDFFGGEAPEVHKLISKVLFL